MIHIGDKCTLYSYTHDHTHKHAQTHTKTRHTHTIYTQNKEICTHTYTLTNIHNTEKSVKSTRHILTSAEIIYVRTGLMNLPG